MPMSAPPSNAPAAPASPGAAWGVRPQREVNSPLLEMPSNAPASNVPVGPPPFRGTPQGPTFQSPHQVQWNQQPAVVQNKRKPLLIGGALLVIAGIGGAAFMLISGGALHGGTHKLVDPPTVSTLTADHSNLYSGFTGPFQQKYSATTGVDKVVADVYTSSDKNTVAGLFAIQGAAVTPGSVTDAISTLSAKVDKTKAVTKSQDGVTLTCEPGSDKGGNPGTLCYFQDGNLEEIVIQPGSTDLAASLDFTVKAKQASEQ